MELFKKTRIGYVCLKDTATAQAYLDKLKALSRQAEGKVKDQIDKQIKMVSYGIDGENEVAYRLRTSGIDMYVLHDIYFEIDGLSAQIDCIVITRKNLYVLECKNWTGNVEITERGDFIRNYLRDGKQKRECVESPIAQNRIHMVVLQRLLEQIGNRHLSKEKFFDSHAVSLVVLSNSKSIIEDSKAEASLREKVVRADTLVERMTQIDNSQGQKISADEMKAIADFLLIQNKNSKLNYVKEYERLEQSLKKKKETNIQSQKAVKKQQKPASKKEKNAEKKTPEEIKKLLKKYRREQSKEQHLSPLAVFDDKQMDALIEKRPKSKAELKAISGFGDGRVKKYGTDIIRIVSD